MDARIARHDLKDIYKEDLPTPCMIVDQEIFDANLRKMATHCRATGIHLRGHVKVHKSVEIARRQIALGGIGVTCATVAECELMSSAGIGNIPLTRQPTSKNNIGRVIALAKHDQTFGTVVDDPLATDWLQAAAALQSLKLRTVADVYAGLTLCVSFGTNPADERTYRSRRNPAADWGCDSPSQCLLLRGVWSNFGFRLRILQRTEFGGHAARDGGRFTRILEAGEIGPVAPRERTAQPFSGGDGCVVHRINQAFVIGIALLVA
jgi:hypothetical protein